MLAPFSLSRQHSAYAEPHNVIHVAWHIGTASGPQMTRCHPRHQHQHNTHSLPKPLQAMWAASRAPASGASGHLIWDGAAGHLKSATACPGSLRAPLPQSGPGTHPWRQETTSQVGKGTGKACGMGDMARAVVSTCTAYMVAVDCPMCCFLQVNVIRNVQHGFHCQQRAPCS